MSRLSAEDRLAVFIVDEFRCIAPLIDPDCGPCRSRWGGLIATVGPMDPEYDLTVEHVVPGYGRTGKRADNVIGSMATMCWGHHLGSGVTGQGGSIWSSKHKDDVRAWLAVNHA